MNLPNNTNYRGGRLAGLLAIAFGIGMAVPATAMAGSSVYPDISQYSRLVALDQFTAISRDGIWFITPLGLKCGIGDDGSYGCTGELPGTPQGENEVAWFPGDLIPRLYHTAEPRFHSGRAHAILPLEHYIEYRGSRCAVTISGELYCAHSDDPNSQFMVTDDSTRRGSDAAPST